MDTTVSRDVNVKNQQRQGKKKDRVDAHRRGQRRWVLLAATANRHKMREIAQILGARFRVLGLDRLAGIPRMVESGRTFDANAALKARCVRDALRRQKNPAGVDYVIADDSGLRVEALRGAPGIRSARYAGRQADDRSNRCKLLREMGADHARRAGKRRLRL
jgi:XTP/dITP diphosphohydrolase